MRPVPGHSRPRFTSCHLTCLIPCGRLEGHPGGHTVLRLQCEASNAHRDVRRHQLREVTLSSLSPQEESQLYTVDRYFVKEYADNSICVAGKRITPKLLAEALRTLPEEKRNAVLLYYFEGMTDNDIAKLLNISRSTVQYRRTSSFELLKRYLEERAYDDEEI